MNEDAIRQWMEETLRKRFDGNLSAWSRAVEGSNMSVSTLHTVMKNGRADAQTLSRLARAAGISPKAVYIIAGLLDPEPDALSAEAQEAARLVEGTRPVQRGLLMAPLRAIAQVLRQEPL